MEDRQLVKMTKDDLDDQTQTENYRLMTIPMIMEAMTKKIKTNYLVQLL